SPVGCPFARRQSTSRAAVATRYSRHLRLSARPGRRRSGMSARTLAAFSTIRTEGAMLPSDILVRVASGDKTLGGLEESSYHLAMREKIGEATNRAWNRLQAAWANFQSAREKL